MKKLKLIFDSFYKNDIKIKILEKAEKIRLLICDVDGVMSNGYIYLGDPKQELKSFNVKDSYGLRSILNASINVAIITGRSSSLTKRYCDSLGIKNLYQGQLDKLVTFNELLKKFLLKSFQVAYIGDDLIDFSVMKKVGLSVAVKDAHPIVLKNANYITKNKGGKGAVREICDLILLSQNKHEKI